MALTSPLSSLSSSESFYTAVNESDAPESTNASSPAVSPLRSWRNARALPRDVKEHCRILLEEQLYSGAIHLLNSILVSGAGSTRQNPSQRPVAIPPPSHLALLNTLVIHPLHTTRAERPEHLEASSLALDYLRNVLALVGPLNADFRTAFQFQTQPRLNRRAAAHSYGNDSDLSMSDEDPSRSEDRLKGKFSNASALWTRSQDFWSTVGWAFNCSALHPSRWKYWRAWLEFMLDVLEKDWDEREARDLSDHEQGGCKGEPTTAARQDALVCLYIEQQNAWSAGYKGVIKAMLADGGDLSTTAFGEIFDKELKARSTGSKKRKRDDVLDIENDKFGDYFDDDSMSSGASQPPTPVKAKGARKTTFGRISTGLVESVNLRLRLFSLVSTVVYNLKSSKELHHLYEQFSVALKVLPLDIFSLCVTQRVTSLRAEAQVTITKELFRLLLPSSYLDPRKVDLDAERAGALSMAILEQCYVGHPANTVGVEENAKLSLVVENAIQMLWLHDMMEYTPSFGDAVEAGITARETKTKKKRLTKVKLEEGDALGLEVMAQSAERIRLLLQVLEASADMDE